MSLEKKLKMSSKQFERRGVARDCISRHLLHVCCSDVVARSPLSNDKTSGLLAVNGMMTRRMYAAGTSCSTTTSRHRCVIFYY